jgi:hypothetical protein
MVKSRTLTEEHILDALEGAGRGTTVRITYYVGDDENVSTTRLLESERAYNAGIPMSQYTGTLEALRRNKRGQWYFTLFVEERDTLHRATGELTPGNFRNFNPSFGELVAIEVTDIVREGWFAL